MATAHHDDDFHIDSDLPPPAYELTHAELDRKIADAAQRSLALSEQPQPGRPILPPIDEDGFPAWDDALFEFNRAEREREREVEHARNSKAQSEYSRPSPHHYAAPSSSVASSSSSPPPSHAQVRPLNPARRSLPPAAPARSPGPDKQKQERFGWLNNRGEIAQDEDPHPPMTATQNVGRPPSVRQGAPLQVQVGPRPHDVLAQPQSPVSDVEDDFVPGAGPGLSRAPTYHPRGQAHPGHARVINERQQQPPQRRSMESNGSGGVSRNGSLDLPPFTAVAPSLEGPAYEEVMRTTTPAGRRVTSPAPASVPPPVPSVPANDRRQSGMEWRPMAARPQPQERVAGARQPTVGPGAVRQSTAASAQWANSPSSYSASPVTPAVHRPAPPAPAPVPVVTSQYGHFDPGLAYRSTQSYTLVGRTDSITGSGVSDGQRALREAGANAFYNAAVASTLTKAPVFKAPPPPPPRTTTMSFGPGADDDAVSVLSGRSGGGRQGSVYSGGAGARSSMYGAPPPGGIMAGGAPPPVPAMPGQGGYVPYQPGFGVQVPGAGGYQQNPPPQPGAYQSMGQAQVGGHQSQWGSPGGVQPQSQGAYQPQGTYQSQGGYQPPPAGAYQPPAGGYQPQSAAMHQPRSPGAYLPQSPGAQQASPGGGLFGAGPGGYKPGQGTAGGYVPGQGFAPPPPPGQFVAPPPPPAAPAPGKKPGKLYKRL